MSVRLLSLVGLALCVSSPIARAQRVAPVAVHRASATRAVSVAKLPRAATADDGRGMRPWLKWGLVGAAAGAVTFPVLGSMAIDADHQPASDAALGAAAGFVIIGGGVALWQALCGPDSASRRAGLCGR